MPSKPSKSAQRFDDDRSADDSGGGPAHMRARRRPRDLDMSDVEADAQRMQDEQYERELAADERQLAIDAELAAAQSDLARAQELQRVLLRDLVSEALASHPLTSSMTVRAHAMLADHIASTVITDDSMRVVVSRREH